MTPGVTHNNEEDEGWTYHTSSPPSLCQLTAARAPRWARCPGWPLCRHPAARRRPYRHAEGAAVCSAALWSSDPGGERRKDQVGRTMRGGKGKRSDVSFGAHWFTHSGSQAHTCPLISSLSLSLSLCFLKLTTSSNTLYGSACSLSLSVSLFSDGCYCWL